MPYDFFRLRNIFDPEHQMAGLGNEVPQGSIFPNPYANDLPEQGGFTGMMGQNRPPMRSIPPLGMPPEPAMEDPFEGVQMESEMSDRLRGMIDSMPVRKPPSGLRRLGGLIVGLGQGPEAAEKAINAPYYQDMADWNAKLGPVLKGAELERYNNANERTLAYQRSQANTSARQQETREEAERRRLAKSEADVARDKAKNEINRFKAQNPNWREEIGDNGNVWLVPPRPDMGKPVDTGLQSGAFTDLEKANWRRGDIQENIQGRIRLRQTPDARSADPNDARNWSIRDVYDDEGNVIGSVSVNKMTQEIKPIPKDSNVQEGFSGGGSLRTKPGPPATQRDEAVNNRIKQYILRNPQDEKYFEHDPATDTWRIKEPGKTFGYATGPSQEKYMQLQGAITGNTKGVRLRSESGGKTRTTSRGTRVTEVD